LPVLKAHDPDRNWEKDAEVQQALAEKLMDLADAGVRNPKELCSRMLQSFDLDAPHRCGRSLHELHRDLPQAG
jgi:hypothetical protein